MRHDYDKPTGAPVIAAWVTVIGLGVILGGLIDLMCWIAVSR